MATALKVCSVPTCMYRNGTVCDRTRQACPRCLIYDPLLRTTICTNLQNGRTCLAQNTLCPATPLGTTSSSGSGYEWVPLATTDSPRSAPLRSSSSSPSPSVQPSTQPTITNNAPLATTTTTSANENQAGVATWAIVFVAASVAVVGSLMVVHFYRKNRHRKHPDAHTIPMPPPFKDEQAWRLERSTNALSSRDGGSSAFRSFASQTIDFNQMHRGPTQPVDPPNQRIDSINHSEWHPQVRATTARPQSPASEISFSLSQDSYRRFSCDSDNVFTETARSVNIDDVDLLNIVRTSVDVDDWRGSLGVDDLEVPSSRTSVAEDKIDIYPDTSMTTIPESERLFSPVTVRSQVPTRSTTFPVYEDRVVYQEEAQYPDTSATALSETHAIKGAGGLERDVLDLWASHRVDPQEPKHALQQQQLAKWKAKYETT